MRETIQIQYGDILRIYQVEEMADLGMRKVYSVYYANIWDITQKSLFICFAKDLNDVRTQFQAVVNERLKTKEQMNAYINRCAQLQVKLDRQEAEFKEYFSFLLNATDNDWVKIDRIKLTNNEHLYRATREKTNDVYYKISCKTSREKLKELIKREIESDILERKLLHSWKRVGDITTSKQKCKILYTCYYLNLSNERTVYKITKKETTDSGNWTSEIDFMIWEGEMVKAERIMQYMDNMKDCYDKQAKEIDNLRERINMKQGEIERLEDANKVLMREEDNYKKRITVLRNELTELQRVNIEMKNKIAKDKLNSVYYFSEIVKKENEKIKEQVKELEEENKAQEAVIDALTAENKEFKGEKNTILEEKEALKRIYEFIIKNQEEMHEVHKKETEKKFTRQLENQEMKYKEMIREKVEYLEAKKRRMKVVLRAEAINRGIVEIKDFEKYVEEVLDDFL